MHSLAHPAIAQAIQAERVSHAMGPRRAHRPRRIHGRRLGHDLPRPVASPGTVR
jgi:hypothetical protein